MRKIGKVFIISRQIVLHNNGICNQHHHHKEVVSTKTRVKYYISCRRQLQKQLQNISHQPQIDWLAATHNKWGSSIKVKITTVTPGMQVLSGIQSDSGQNYNKNIAQTSKSEQSTIISSLISHQLQLSTTNLLSKHYKFY